MTGSVIICGLGKIGWRVIETFAPTGMKLVAIDDRAQPDDPRLLGVTLIRGDFRNIVNLEAAGVRTATGVLLMTSDDLHNIAATLLIRKLNPDVRIVLRMFNQNLLSRLGSTVNNVTALSVSALAAPMIAANAMARDVQASYLINGQRYEVQHSELFDNSLAVRASAGYFQKQTGLQIIWANHPPQWGWEQSPEQQFQTGNQLVLHGPPTAFDSIAASTSVKPHKAWYANRFTRWFRVLVRTAYTADRMVQIGAVLLLSVFFGSMLTFHFGLKASWPDAFIRTIGAVITGDDVSSDNYPGWGKFFVGSLRLTGTILVAAFTAILTNFLIRARLGGVLEVRRIPDAGHIVVVGLGNMGLRVAFDLHDMEEEVVVIELKADNPFVGTCRRKGIAVLTADATVTDVLKQARADQAKAIICTTNSDLANLEITLLVREMNATQRIIPLLADTTLAETARTSAQVPFALSIPELAAPAFVAALFGDQIRAVFTVEHRLLFIVELKVHDNLDSLFDQTAMAISIDYHCVPVAIVSAEGNQSAPDSAYRLKVGDTLRLIAPLDHLDRLSRRLPAPRNQQVVVQQFPLTARDYLLNQLKITFSYDDETASKTLETPPFVLANHLSLGNALAMKTHLQRDKVAVTVEPCLR
ncbi:MAG: NAD-binding protein [Zavarzinella sp.]